MGDLEAQILVGSKARRRGIALTMPRRSNAGGGQKMGFPFGAGPFLNHPASFVVGIVTTMPPPQLLVWFKNCHSQIPITYTLINRL